MLYETKRYVYLLGIGSSLWSGGGGGGLGGGLKIEANEICPSFIEPNVNAGTLHNFLIILNLSESYYLSLFFICKYI